MSKIGEIVRGIGAWEAEVEAITLRTEEAAKVIEQFPLVPLHKQVKELLVTGGPVFEQQFFIGDLDNAIEMVSLRSYIRGFGNHGYELL